jgi:hypothetical protein
MGVGASASEVVEWFELLRNVLAPSVKLDAWFPAVFSPIPALSPAER